MNPSCITGRNRGTAWHPAQHQPSWCSAGRALADLLEIRASDPYRELNPLAWRAATQPPVES